MSRFRVVLVTTSSTTVDVEADDIESAIEEAHERMPGDICAGCSGYGHTSWWRELGDDWDAVLVEDGTGAVVWERKDER